LRWLFALYVFGGWAFFAHNFIKGDLVAFVQFLKCHATQVLGMKEQILCSVCLTFTNNESEFSILNEGFDSSGHMIVFMTIYDEKLDYVSVSYKYS